MSHSVTLNRCVSTSMNLEARYSHCNIVNHNSSVRKSVTKCFENTFYPLKVKSISPTHLVLHKRECGPPRKTLFVTAAHATEVTTLRKQVVVTREKGMNGKLMKALAGMEVGCLELPLIEHAQGPELGRLQEELQEGGWDWVLVTSPEGAKVLKQEWEAVGRPSLRVAAVGEGTAVELEGSEGLAVDFMPSKAIGKVFAAELPFEETSHRVLYAASVKAGTDVQDGLLSRGFEVLRLNTYTTRAVKNVDPAVLELAKLAKVVTFASPSTIKAWVAFMGDAAFQPNSPAIACIGKTSADACEKAGLKNIFYPEKPGIDGW
eukprot:CAMPEP_0196587316 /NCGR_PEP_ID=MMETSP1081-20130531/57105_1 /TAXON_ID=36882 /ORGANISM="Pyramimonas amylifera, Strain CCMP720" /LENGTH=318 /DNA_ID=CAMNT_0041909471 /DNA_START=110 /DNA_END=1063 /DNA_ORIENTATION=+